MTNASKILAIDTSSSLCTVALLNQGEIAVRQTESPKQAAQQLLPMIHVLMEDAGLSLDSLDGIAIASGPGSFTGLRIGVGVAQGLSLAAGIPVIPLSNLAVSAYSALKVSSMTGALVCNVARDDEFYFAAYAADARLGVILIGEEQVNSAARLKLSQSSVVDHWVGVGDAWESTEMLQKALAIEVADTCPFTDLKAPDLFELAEMWLQSGKVVAPEAILPNYVKEQLDYSS